MLGKPDGLTKTNDASNTRYSERYQQTYHSTFGAVAEAKHVFLQGSAVQDRLDTKQPTRVLEIGFGLGLNCLLTADYANTQQTNLHFTSIEHLPIASSTLQELDYGRWLQTPTLVDDLARVLSSSNQRVAPVQEAANAGKVIPEHAQIGLNQTKLAALLGAYAQIELHIQDASSTSLFDALKAEPKFDAIYLDAFSPEVNPECWTVAFFESLAPLLGTQGRLATYCVKGKVRRGLQDAGFTVNKYPGPAGKREVLYATLTAAK